MNYLIKYLLPDIIIISSFIIFQACSKHEEAPVVKSEMHAPTATITAATEINPTTAKLNGTVNANNLPTTVTFEYGLTTSYENSVDINLNLKGGTSKISTNITGLIPATVYHYRLKAVNSLGTAYGSDITFITTIADADGNNYKVVAIGNQLWMHENLNTTRYNNGDPIGTTSSSAMDITTEIAPSYQWDSHVAGYGRKYTYCVLTDSRGVCPAGWHVPSDADWTVLTDHLISDGQGYEGSGTDIAKSLGSVSGWVAELTAGNLGYEPEKNNSSGFDGLPAGGRYSSGVVSFVGYHGIWGSSTESSENSAFFRCIGYIPGEVFRGVFKKSYGLSVRCLKNN